MVGERVAKWSGGGRGAGGARATGSLGERRRDAAMGAAQLCVRVRGWVSPRVRGCCTGGARRERGWVGRRRQKRRRRLRRSPSEAAGTRTRQPQVHGDASHFCRWTCTNSGEASPRVFGRYPPQDSAGEAAATAPFPFFFGPPSGTPLPHRHTRFARDGRRHAEGSGGGGGAKTWQREMEKKRGSGYKFGATGPSSTHLVQCLSIPELHRVELQVGAHHGQ